MAKSFLQRIQKVVIDAYDPDRDQRIERLAAKLFKDLRAKRQKFSLQDSTAGLDVSATDIEMAKESTFRRLLDIVWKDGVISKGERETLLWVERSLGLSRKKATEIRQEYAVDQFRVALARAMDDGVLADDEYEHLTHIASSIGETASSFARQFFLAEGEGFLQSLFFAAIEDGSLSQDAWANVVKTGQRFGVTDIELAKLIEIPAKRFVEHVLADAKADEQLTSPERSQLEWLMSTFQLDHSFCEYVRCEMNEVELRYQISLGRLPSYRPPPGVALRSGEIVHGSAHADWILVRMLKSGPKQDVHRGMLTLLDSRAIFQSPTKSQSITYRRIIALRCDRRVIDIQLDGKPVWRLHLHNESPLFALVFRKAIALANQTVTRASAGTPSRHIPRDVRQRVWQRYGGQCVDCGAKDYLEFDHVIPVAKGGSNSDTNVQLLCRRCNQKKSDHI